MNRGPPVKNLVQLNLKKTSIACFELSAAVLKMMVMRDLSLLDILKKFEEEGQGSSKSPTTYFVSSENCSVESHDG